MKRWLLIIFLIFAATFLYAKQNSSITSSLNGNLSDDVDFHGYFQLRGMTNFGDYNSFALRRLKFWIKSPPEFFRHWSYKVQVLFTSWMQEKFFLQDAKIGYKTGLFSFDIGQFIPQYSFQRFQPDYLIPASERAKAINALIPDGTMGVRDIGLQGNFSTKNKLFQTHLGIFNGYGIKEYRFGNKGYMLSHKSQFNIPLYKSGINLGYSLQYRNAEDLQLRFIFPDSIRYTGNDFRYNLFAAYNSQYFDIQAEYLNANFDGQRAYGYYVLTNIHFKKHEIVLSFEDYNDLIATTNDKPYYRIGYNYLIKNHRIKLFWDNHFQLINNKIENYLMTIQIQFFIK